mgnify:CR=1 FL=1
MSHRDEIDQRLVYLSASKAKYTVLLFWDVDCGHCKKEVPILQAYYDSLHAAGISFEVYAVHSELDEVGWKQYIKEHKLKWVNVHSTDRQELGTAKYYYDVFSTPTIVLLDKNKNIVAKRIDADNLKIVLNREIDKARKQNAAGGH